MAANALKQAFWWTSLHRCGKTLLNNKNIVFLKRQFVIELSFLYIKIIRIDKARIIVILLLCEEALPDA